MTKKPPLPKTILCLATIAVTVSHSLAANPTLGGPMRHLLITMPGTEIQLGRDHDPSQVMSMADYCESYEAAAAILDGAAYNGQYGWLANGFISLPQDLDIWIEVLSQSDGLETYEQGTYQPIFGTDSSDVRWRWSGVMTHNWYVVMMPGTYSATYRVYVADSNGDPASGYTSSIITLVWEFGSTCISGDMNCDSFTDLEDVADFAMGILNGAGMTANQNCALDADKDAVIDGRDITEFVELIVGM